MKLNFLITLFLLIWSISTFGQKVENIMFADFKAGKKVLKLDIQSDMDYPYLILGIVKKDEKVVYTADFNARKGVHHYDLRFLDQWEGEIKYLLTNLDKRTIRRSALVEPTFLEELDIFLDRELFSSRIVNFTKLKTFFGYSLTYWLFTLAVLLTGGIYYFGKKNLPIAIFISCIIVTVFQDFRMCFQHKRVIEQVENKYPYIEPTVETQRFLEAVKPIIKNGPWTCRPSLIDEYLYLYLKYSLSDIPFLRDDLAKYPKDTYIISVLPPLENQKIVLSKNGFNLIQQL